MFYTAMAVFALYIFLVQYGLRRIATADNGCRRTPDLTIACPRVRVRNMRRLGLLAFSIVL